MYFSQVPRARAREREGPWERTRKREGQDAWRRRMENVGA